MLASKPVKSRFVDLPKSVMQRLRPLVGVPALKSANGGGQDGRGGMGSGVDLDTA